MNRVWTKIIVDRILSFWNFYQMRRLDSRTPNQIRTMSCALGTLSIADGSAKFSFGIFDHFDFKVNRVSWLLWMVQWK